MKAVLMMACVVFASGAFAADCVTNSNGKTVCSNGDKAVVVSKNTGTVKWRTGTPEERRRPYRAETAKLPCRKRTAAG